MRAPLLTAAALSLALVTATSAFAGWKGTIEFTEAEKAAHLKALPQIMDTAAECLEADLTRHKQFIKRYGVSAFYGDNSAFAVKTDASGARTVTTKEEKRQMLRDEGVDESLVMEMIPDAECKGGLEECPNLMQPTSCIGLVMKCLKKGMLEAGHQDQWQKIRLFALANGVTGNSLIHALQQLGWTTAYWNPATKRNAKWDEKDKKDYPDNPKGIWGQHVATWESVRTKQLYYWNKVDDFESLVDFGLLEPRWLKKVPFFIGIAHLGYHVFPGTYGEIMEGHSARSIDDKRTIEKSKFQPLWPGGGPRGGQYNSGLMAIPPGYLE